MPTEIIMPQMGESIAEGTLVRWLKRIGDRVERDEPLFEISTDKVDTEIPSPCAGVLTEIRVEEGQTVAVQSVVAVLATEAGTVEAGGAGTAENAASPGAPISPSPSPAAVTTSTATLTVKAPPGSGASSTRTKTRSSPLVRRIAREHGVDLADIPATGSNGRVSKSDILAYLDRQNAAAAPTIATAPTGQTPTSDSPSTGVPGFESGDVRIEPISKMRQKIAAHMVASKHTSPHVTTVFEVDMTGVARLIADNKVEFLRTRGVKLTYMPFIMKATINALRVHHVINASLAEDSVRYFKKVHLGIAVSLDDGLIVPVVKNAEEKSLLGLARTVHDLASRARSKKLQPAEVQGGTFTISNHGVFGSLFATPIINQPQVGILGVGTVTRRPVVLPETDAIAIRSMMYLSLSFDHRLVDGAIADKFVAAIKANLESCSYSLDS